MPDVQEFIEKVRKNPEISGVRFNRIFVESVADYLEKRNYEETKLFIWEQSDRRDIGMQIKPLLLLLDELQKYGSFRGNPSKQAHFLKTHIKELLK